MSDQNNQTILVKKSDGTFVRVPLADVQKMQSTSPSATPSEPVTKVADKLPESKPVHHSDRQETGTKPARIEHPGAKEKPEKIAKPQPLHLAHKAKNEMPKFAEVDLEPEALLEEELPVPPVPQAPKVSVKRDDQVDEIIQSLSFKISLGNGNRFRTILQLFLKDVRSADQTRDLLMRKEIDGGLGLNNSQVDEVLQKAGYRNPLKFEKTTETAGLPSTPKVNDRLEHELPMVPVLKKPVTVPKVEIKKPLPPLKTSSPLASAPLPKPPGTQMGSTKAELDAAVTRASLSDAPAMPATFKIHSEAKPKATMADVVAHPVELTPVDEIRYFTLTDFRRLATDPQEAVKRLQQKFINLKDESIVLYFEALDAWKSAPLYREYLALVAEALGKRQPVASFAQDKNRIQIPEMQALLQMEKQLV